MTKVRIDTPGAKVELESDDPLIDVAVVALQLFQDAGGWPQQPAGPAMGFSSSAFARYTPPVQPSSMRRAPRPYPNQIEHEGTDLA